MDEQIFEKAWAVSKKGQYVFQPGQTMGQRAMTAAGDWARGGEGISRFNNPIEAARAGNRARTGRTPEQQIALNERMTRTQQAAERGKWSGMDSNLANPVAAPPAQVPLTERWQYKAAQTGIKPAAPASSAAPTTGAQEIPGDGIDNDGDGLIDEPPTVEEKRSTTINPNTGAPAEQTTSTTVTNPTEQQAATNAAANTTASDGTNPTSAPSGGGQQSVADINAQAQAGTTTTAQNFTRDTPTQNLIGAQMAEENKKAITDATARSQTSGGLATNPLAFLATGGLANIGGALYNHYERGRGRRDLATAKNQRNQLASGDLIQNSINEDIADYWELQKTRSHIREYDTTEAIRIAYD